MNQPFNPSLNHNQGPIVATVLTEPTTQDVDFIGITHRGATTREDSLIPQAWLSGKKKVQFDFNTEKDTFFEAWDEMRRNSGKLPIYEMPTSFDSTLEEGPLQQHRTLHNLFEIFLSLVRDPNALVDIENLLHRLDKGQKDSVVNSLHKKQTRKKR